MFFRPVCAGFYPFRHDIITNDVTLQVNLLLVKQAAHELGGIPSLVNTEDMSETVPDSKVVRMIVSFLCSRLLNVKEEDRWGGVCGKYMMVKLWLFEKAYLLHEAPEMLIPHMAHAVSEYPRKFH